MTVTMTASAPHSQSGFALLIVLWSMALLALLGTRITAAGRIETQIAFNLRDAAIAEARADGAVHEAVYHLLDPSRLRWIADGQWRRLEDAHGTTDILLTDPRAYANPNTAPPALMAALIREVGGDPRHASAIAAAIFDWRAPGQIPSPGGAKAAQYRAAGRAYGPSGRRFADLDELGAVLGMTPDLLAAMRPFLSLYNFGQIDPVRADPLLSRALKAAGIGQPSDDDVGQVAMVHIRVTLANGVGFSRRATLLLRPGTGGRPFRILSWEIGDG